jgi:prefoldin subunit 5
LGFLLLQNKGLPELKYVITVAIFVSAVTLARPGCSHMADDLSFLSDRVRTALSKDEHVLAQLRSFDDEYAELQRVVRDLPKKTHHDVMVPFTDLAFFPGRLIHTNELTVLLGGDLYAERSAEQTLGIVERRRESLREKIAVAAGGVDAMGARLGALSAVQGVDGAEGNATGAGGDETGTFETRTQGRAFLTSKPDGTVEITETYGEDEPLDVFDLGTGGVGTSGTSGRSSGDDETDGDEAKQLDDFIQRLEAREAAEAAGEGGESIDGDGNDQHEGHHESDSDDDSEYDERSGIEAAASVDGDAGVNRLARWKAEQAAIAAAKRRHAVPTTTVTRDTRRVAVGTVTERQVGVGNASVGGGGGDSSARPMSKFKMRQMGIDPEDEGF